MTVDDIATAGLKWAGRDAERSQFLDGGVNWCGLMGALQFAIACVLSPEYLLLSS
jgi:hypothetical protein